MIGFSSNTLVIVPVYSAVWRKNYGVVPWYILIGVFPECRKKHTLASPLVPAWSLAGSSSRLRIGTFLGAYCSTSELVQPLHSRCFEHTNIMWLNMRGKLVGQRVDFHHLNNTILEHDTKCSAPFRHTRDAMHIGTKRTLLTWWASLTFTVTRVFWRPGDKKHLLCWTTGPRYEVGWSAVQRCFAGMRFEMNEIRAASKHDHLQKSGAVTTTCCSEL